MTGFDLLPEHRAELDAVRLEKFGGWPPTRKASNVPEPSAFRLVAAGLGREKFRRNKGGRSARAIL